jgi:polygalacturonase
VSNVVCSNCASNFGCIISGIPGFEIRDVKLHDIYIQHRGGGTGAQAEVKPAENEAKYPEPNMLGEMPSQGFYLRHIKNIELRGIEVAAMNDDARPAFILQNVEGANIFLVKAPPGVPVLELHASKDIQAMWVRGVKDGSVSSSE